MNAKGNEFNLCQAYRGADETRSSAVTSACGIVWYNNIVMPTSSRAFVSRSVARLYSMYVCFFLYIYTDVLTLYRTADGFGFSSSSSSSDHDCVRYIIIICYYDLLVSRVCVMCV